MSYTNITTKSAGGSTPAVGKILDTDINQIIEAIQTAVKDINTFKLQAKLINSDSPTGYVLVNRLTTTEKTALTPVNGMIIYDSTLNKFQGYENGSWVNLI